MKNKLYKLMLALAVLVSTQACSLDEFNPESSQTEDQVLSTYSGFKAFQTKCYQSLTGYLSGFDYLLMTEGGTDTWVTGSNKTWGQQVFYYEGLATNTGYVNKVFTNAYSMINNCNTVIAKASGVEDGEQSDIDILVAEARYLRAFYYSILVAQYGPITLNTEPTEVANLNPQRNTEEEIYTQIVSDLKLAAEDLPLEPFEGNRGRVTKKAALGLLARVYAQGAGEDLSEDGVSYWVKAKEAAEYLIENADAVGAYLYDDVEDMWAQANNQSNREALFIASGPNPDDASYWSVKTSNIFSFTYPNPYKMSEIYPIQDKQNYLYGRINNNVLAPSKYLVDCFDADYDIRWENSFTTAYGGFSMVQPGWIAYGDRKLTLTEEICTKYGIDASHIGKVIYPYADVAAVASAIGGNQYEASVWPKGEHSGNIEKLEKVKNVYANPYPLDVDEDRFSVYLSKDYLSDEEKAKRAYFTINIDDLFDTDGNYKSSMFDGTNSYQMFPALSKYNWNFYGAFYGSNLQRKNGDVIMMRMAEVYLIAAEANMQLGNNGLATEQLNVLRKRACRNAADFDAHMKLTTADMNDVYDEYARELCGEFGRWYLLKRHQAFEERLAIGNKRAAASFTRKNYLRPISYDFLSSINNADEYGTNGY